MTEKTTKKSTAKKIADKVVDAVSEIGNQQIQEQDLMKGKVPQEPKQKPVAETKAEPKVELGITLNNKDGISAEEKDGKIIISFPNRKDINYAFNEKSIGLKNELAGFSDSDLNNKLYDREKLQQKSVAYNITDLTPETATKIQGAIETARAINAEIISERDAAMDYFKSIADGKEIRTYGIPFKQAENKESGKMEINPSWYTGEIVQVGKQLVCSIEIIDPEYGKDKMCVRLIETNKLPLTAQEYSDKKNAAKNHLGIKEENISKVEINGKQQDIVKDVKRYVAFSKGENGNNWHVSKITEYTPKQEQAQTQAKAKKQVHTMAR